MSSRIQRQNFGQLLTKAIRTIAIHEDKNISVVQDQVGNSLRKKNGEFYTGGSIIEHWRKGNLPPDHDTILELTRVLVERQGLTEAECKRFLRAAGMHRETEFLTTLFTVSATVSSSTTADNRTTATEQSERIPTQNSEITSAPTPEPAIAQTVAIPSESTPEQPLQAESSSEFSSSVAITIPWNRRSKLILTGIVALVLITATILYFRQRNAPPPLEATQTNAFPATYTDLPPRIDGDLSDPAWQAVEPIIFAEHPPKNGSSLARIKLLWDDSYLYAAFDVDDSQVEDAGVEVWNSDSVSLMVDSDYVQRSPDSFEFRHTLTGIESADRAGSLESRHRLKAGTTFNVTTDTDRGYTVEMRIAWTKRPAANALLQIDILSVDHDGNPGGKFDDENTIFSKIFWDNDNTVDKGEGYLILVDQ